MCTYIYIYIYAYIAREPRIASALLVGSGRYIVYDVIYYVYINIIICYGITLYTNIQCHCYMIICIYIYIYTCTSL